MDRKPFQFSIFSLLVLTTVCAVLLSFVKTFPNASARVAAFVLIMAEPWLFGLGSLLVLHPTLFFPDGPRFARIYARLAGLLCIITGILLFLFLY
jgi:hypothetical protein